jgi:hypothetical protein
MERVVVEHKELVGKCWSREIVSKSECITSSARAKIECITWLLREKIKCFITLLREHHRRMPAEKEDCEEFQQQFWIMRETNVDAQLKVVDEHLKFEMSERDASKEELEQLLAVEVAMGVQLQAEATRASACETEPLDERVPGLTDNALTKLQVASRQKISRNPSSFTKFSSFTL